ncbi:hypothetical protein [Pseudidiomarina aestuarii]|uniref:hypothetical protein n=1 Tax=Pseudidiomarina aestuarii TaxID=624146 RepID=UPI003A96EB5F
MIYSLIATVLPGLFRVLLIWFLALAYTDELAAPLIATLLLASSLMMFSSTGLGLIYIQLLQGMNRPSASTLTLKTNALNTLFSVIGVSASVIFLSASFSDLLLITLALSCWQLERHAWIGQRQFRSLAVAEVSLLLVASSAPFVVAPQQALLVISGIIFIVTALMLGWRLYGTRGGNSENTSTLHVARRGLFVGSANFLSGGFIMLLPALLATHVSANTILVIGLIVTIVGTLFILPRSYFNIFIGLVSRQAKRLRLRRSLMKMINRRLQIVVAGMFVPGIIACLFYLLASGIEIDLNRVVLVVIITTVMSIGQLYLLESNLVVYLGKEHITFWVSAVTFGVMLITTHLVANADLTDSLKLNLIFIMLGILYLIRWGFFVTLVKPYYRESNR